MKSRLPKLSRLAAFAALISLATLGNSASNAASVSNGLAYYRLTSSQDIAAPASNSTAPQVIAGVLPPGSIVPPTQSDGTQISPLTILNTSTGFDPNQLIVALKDNAADATTKAPASQLFGLSFFGTGFKSDGGHLDFSLSVDKSLTTAPALQAMTPGVSIASIPDPTMPSTPVTPPPSTTASLPNVTTPEPMSIAIWSAFAGIGLLRARRFRRKFSV